MGLLLCSNMNNNYFNARQFEETFTRDLTQRQTLIYILFANGWQDQRIGEKLYITPDLVRREVLGIGEKFHILGRHKRRELIKLLAQYNGCLMSLDNQIIEKIIEEVSSNDEEKKTIDNLLQRFKDKNKAIIASGLLPNLVKAIKERLSEYLNDAHRINSFNADYLNRFVDIKSGNLHQLQELSKIPAFNCRKFTCIGIGLKQCHIFYIYLESECNCLRANNIFPSLPINPSERPWYKAAIQASKETWGEIYCDHITCYLAASMPSYNQTGALEAVLLTEFSLSKINSYLRDLHRKNCKFGQIFIIERSGMLVATSTGEQVFAKNCDSEMDWDNLFQRIEAINSKNSLTRATAKFLKAKNLETITQPRKITDFSIDGDEYILQLQPLEDEYGLNLLVIFVVSMSDMAAIDVNHI